jgi:hypothetical protein
MNTAAGIRAYQIGDQSFRVSAPAPLPGGNALVPILDVGVLPLWLRAAELPVLWL